MRKDSRGTDLNPPNSVSQKRSTCCTQLDQITSRTIRGESTARQLHVTIQNAEIRLEGYLLFTSGARVRWIYTLAAPPTRYSPALFVWHIRGFDFAPVSATCNVYFMWCFSKNADQRSLAEILMAELPSAYWFPAGPSMAPSLDERAHGSSARLYLGSINCPGPSGQSNQVSRDTSFRKKRFGVVIAIGKLLPVGIESSTENSAERPRNLSPPSQRNQFVVRS